MTKPTKAQTEEAFEILRALARNSKLLRFAGVYVLDTAVQDPLCRHARRLLKQVKGGK